MSGPEPEASRQHRAPTASGSRLDVAIDGSIHLAAITLCGMVLVAAGQPIFSDDVWWHLALGEAYLREGPWLARDPLLFTSNGPPPPTSWLADVLFRVVWNHLGFTGLRLLHVGLVALFLLVVWAGIRRATRSTLLASLSTALVGTLSAYRLVQLRPHLATILAALLLHWLLFGEARPPSWRRGLAAVLLMGLWANLHPAYPLGPLLVAAASVAVFVASILPGSTRRESSFESDRATSRVRATRLAVVALLGFAATLLNPLGLAGYRAAFEAGSGDGGLAVVVDEWSRIDLLTWPTASLPPSLLNWAVAWLLVIAVPLATAAEFRSRCRRASADAANPTDPVIVILAWIGLAAMLLATRFAWMVFWPVLFLDCQSGERLRFVTRRHLVRAVVAVASVLLVLVFPRWGDWPMVTRGLSKNFAGYLSPYAVGKYHTAAVAVLREARLEGNLFGRYSEGGFQSFWLAPAIRTAMNGSLNMSEEAFSAALAIRERIGTPAHPRFEDALDALGVDLFLGTGLPRTTRPGRPPDYSTLYLEGTPGWILLFRNLDSALYLRVNARNKGNLARIGGYYRRLGIPFDRKSGFDPAIALRMAPGWAWKMGLWSSHLDRRNSRSDADPIGSTRAGRSIGVDSDRLALGYLVLGLYAEAEAQNERFLSRNRSNARALRRRAWLMLRPGRSVSRPELARAIRDLSDRPGSDRLAAGLLQLLRRRWVGQPVPDRWSRTIPVLTRMEARMLLLGRASPLLVSRKSGLTDDPARDRTGPF